MRNGYWIIRVDITEHEAFKAYAASNHAALNKFGARFLVRAGAFTVVEGSTRSRNTIVEFPSYQAALDCWHSPEYQAARRLRVGAADIDLVIIEGLDGMEC
jgi:uncharacterized protein (DUF1330 family)